MKTWKQEQEARRIEEDRRLEEHYRDMQATPFEPSASETVGSMIGGLLGLVIYGGFWILVCVAVYLVGKAVIG
jgi:hypothetical protein